MSSISDRGDGRNIDPELGLLEGEGAQQVVASERSASGGTPPFGVWTTPPSTGWSEGDPSYYDRPVLKEPVWKWYVPAYFAVGDAAGAAAALGAAAQVVDRRELDGLIRRSRWIAATGAASGTVLLIADLGKPERFFNMLRVFRPTSPMNLGSWILSTLAPAAVGAAAFSSFGGLVGTLGDLSGLVAGLAGPPLTGYTAALVSNTAVPVWQQTRRTLPPLFVSSAGVGAASILQLMRLNDREEAVVRRFAVGAAAADLISGSAVEWDAGRVERVGRPLHEGVSGTLLRAAKALTGASLAINLLPGRGRWKRTVAGVLGLSGAVAVKFGIAEAGKASAADPRATFAGQHEGFGAAEVVADRGPA